MKLIPLAQNLLLLLLLLPTVLSLDVFSKMDAVGSLNLEDRLLADYRHFAADYFRCAAHLNKHRHACCSTAAVAVQTGDTWSHSQTYARTLQKYVPSEYAVDCAQVFHVCIVYGHPCCTAVVWRRRFVQRVNDHWCGSQSDCLLLVAPMFHHINV
jgi:hypothetical protein